jgi:hypothetical protein
MRCARIDCLHVPINRLSDYLMTSIDRISRQRLAGASCQSTVSLSQLERVSDGQMLKSAFYLLALNGWWSIRMYCGRWYECISCESDGFLKQSKKLTCICEIESDWELE